MTTSSSDQIHKILTLYNLTRAFIVQIAKKVAFLPQSGRLLLTNELSHCLSRTCFQPILKVSKHHFMQTVLHWHSNTSLDLVRQLWVLFMTLLKAIISNVMAVKETTSLDILISSQQRPISYSMWSLGKSINII